MGLDDVDFDESVFELVVGQPSVSWPVLPAGANLTHSYVVKPLAEGTVPVNGARVLYRPARGADHTVSLSSGYGNIPIQSYDFYQRTYGEHYVAWAKFVCVGCRLHRPPCSRLFLQTLLHNRRTRFLQAQVIVCD